MLEVRMLSYNFNRLLRLKIMHDYNHAHHENDNVTEALASFYELYAAFDFNGGITLELLKIFATDYYNAAIYQNDTKVMDWFNSINDLDDIIDKFEEDHELLFNMIKATIYFGSIDYHDQQLMINNTLDEKHLKTILRLDAAYLDKINPVSHRYHIISLYRKYGHGCDEKDAIKVCLDYLKTLEENDIYSYHELTNDIILVNYLYVKARRDLLKTSIEEMDESIISNVSDHSREIYSDNLMGYMLSQYVWYNTHNMELSLSDIMTHMPDDEVVKTFKKNTTD